MGVRMLSGRIAFLPWVTLPSAMEIDGFRFEPTAVAEAGRIFGDNLADVARKAMATHVDQSGKPISSCTVVTRPRGKVKWNITNDLVPRVFRASEILALCCLSEQKFFLGHFAPHLNSSMFRGVNMRVQVGSEDVGLTYQRRDGALSVAGRRLSGTVFQQPFQIEGTECQIANKRLLKSLGKAKSERHEVWERLEGSISLFLLANAETPDLESESCVMLSAFAFERLLRPQQANARCLAEAFATLWRPFVSVALSDAVRTKTDHRESWHAEQLVWPIHRKWMKELYEMRSSHAHAGPKDELSSNWAAWQHVVLAAYTYPLALKNLLANAGFYELDDDEQVACEVLDRLLDSDWGHGWERPPEWPTILSMAQSVRGIQRAIEKAMDV